MPKDAPEPRRLTMADVLADMDAAELEPVEIGDLPSLSAAVAITRTPRTLPIPDLTCFRKLWQLHGEGNTGKTLLARWLIEKLAVANKLDDAVIAALAPGNRNLVDFAPGTMQPPSADPTATAAWGLKYMEGMRRLGRGGVWDFGGGDTSFRMMLAAEPDMATRAEHSSVALVPAYLLSPRLDDLAFLKAFERQGYQPQATALILNLGKADTPAAFNGIRRQPEYRAALDRGAVELWLPAMPQHVALAIERARSTFGEARDGGGKRAVAISALERVQVREWLLAMDAEFSAIESWLPWV